MRGRNLPGFTAEASLAKKRGDYADTVSRHGKNDGVVPQIWTITHCFNEGGYDDCFTLIFHDEGQYTRVPRFGNPFNPQNPKGS
jgi:hypothetical protein